MGQHVAVVTDSAAYLDAGEAARNGILVVPLRIVVDGETYSETEPLAARRVTCALRQGRPVSTSRPSTSAFLTAYRAAADAGATAIVSVHLSGDLSGTKDAARLAGLDAPVPTHVVDSRQVTMGLGFAVLAAASAAAGGAGPGEVVSVARRRAAASSTLFYVDTLDHLRRGGRIGAAQGLVGSALAVKPLLHVDSGRIAVLRKVRTGARARVELEQVAMDRAGAVAANGDVEVAVHHLASAERAAALAERLRERIPRLRRLVVREAGGAIGAHVGPGMLAVVIAPTVG